MQPSYKVPVLIGFASLLCFAFADKPDASGIYGGVTAQQVSDQVNAVVSSALANVPTISAMNAALSGVPTVAQMNNAISSATSGLASTSGMNSALSSAISGLATSSALSAIAATIPTPASTAPPTELVIGSAGSAPTFRRGDAVQPRITRSSTITLDASGNGTFDWTTQGALAMPVQPILTPIYAGASAPSCTATAVSGTAVSVKCIFGNPVFLTLGQLTTAGASGMSLNPFVSPAAGISVAIVALPKS